MLLNRCALLGTLLCKVTLIVRIKQILWVYYFAYIGRNYTIYHII